MSVDGSPPVSTTTIGSDPEPELKNTDDRARESSEEEEWSGGDVSPDKKRTRTKRKRNPRSQEGEEPESANEEAERGMQVQALARQHAIVLSRDQVISGDHLRSLGWSVSIQQTAITPDHRAKLYHWMLELAVHHRLSFDCLWQAYAFVDSVVNGQPDEFQLAACGPRERAQHTVATRYTCCGLYALIVSVEAYQPTEGHHDPLLASSQLVIQKELRGLLHRFALTDCNLYDWCLNRFTAIEPKATPSTGDVLLMWTQRLRALIGTRTTTTTSTTTPEDVAVAQTCEAWLRDASAWNQVRWAIQCGLVRRWNVRTSLSVYVMSVLVLMLERYVERSKAIATPRPQISAALAHAWFGVTKEALDKLREAYGPALEKWNAEQKGWVEHGWPECLRQWNRYQDLSRPDERESVWTFAFLIPPPSSSSSSSLTAPAPTTSATTSATTSETTSAAIVAPATTSSRVN